MSTQGKAQFTSGPTCTCEIVMRTGETLDSSLGNRPCSDISRILLCPFHTAAPAMYEALSMAHNMLYMLKQGFPSEALCSENNPWGQDTGTLPDGKKVSRSAYMKKADEATAVALSQAEGR